MTVVRDYMSGPHDSPKCDCRHDGLYWQKRCAAAAANDREESLRWQGDRERRNTTTRYFVTVLPTMAGPDPWHANNEDLR